MRARTFTGQESSCVFPGSQPVKPGLAYGAQVEGLCALRWAQAPSHRPCSAPAGLVKQGRPRIPMLDVPLLDAGHTVGGNSYTPHP